MEIYDLAEAWHQRRYFQRHAPYDPLRGMTSTKMKVRNVFALLSEKHRAIATIRPNMYT